MFRRAAETLIDLLLLELRRLEKATKLRSLDSLTHLKLYETTLQMLGIGEFSFWMGKESKKLECRALTGPEKLILFSRTKVAGTFPQIPNSDKVPSLWTDLLHINSLLSTKPSDITPALVAKNEADSKKFLELFVQLSSLRHICIARRSMSLSFLPYMELFCPSHNRA